MKNYKVILAVIFSFAVSQAFGQNMEEKINSYQKKIDSTQQTLNQLIANLKELKLVKVQKDIQKYGIPKLEDGDTVINHTAMSLCYSEKHEQSKWVVHIITPDIIYGGYGRTNDFREDSLVKTGTPVTKDYWYSGFDRGHLAPSSDFRWNLKALSESYFYSNMSPQRPEFNREIWAELESAVRSYVYEKKEQVIVVTGGILKDGLPKMGKVNKISIPEKFYKVVIDIEGDTTAGIGFIIPNEECDDPVMSYAVSIDEVEKQTGIDFFSSLPDSLENKLEASFDYKLWQTGHKKGNVLPIHRRKLPKNSYNTVQARSHYDEKGKVCGTVVSIHKSKKGNIFMNLDQKFPNQIFWCTIWKSNSFNFSYDVEKVLMYKKICVKGVIKEKYGNPSMSLQHEKQISFYKDEMKKKK